MQRTPTNQRDDLIDLIAGALIHNTWSWVDGEEAARAFAEQLADDILSTIAQAQES
jgi:hypothetical protein